MKIYIAAILWILTASCTSYSPIINDKNLKDSEIEIQYGLGHNQYTFIAKALTDTAELTSIRDNKALETKKIPLQRYEDFVKKVEQRLQEQVESKNQEKSLSPECRTPYSITIRAKKKVQTLQGCRANEDQAMIGDFLKEGEFLFYGSPEESTTHDE